ncbi:MAG: hypothetical protein K0Q49_2311 [Haloplasmataceae bacterium]|jgi:phage FluMu protein Com|nr:hypothetical protein [Haloplasmataceae bacterium]
MKILKRIKGKYIKKCPKCLDEYIWWGSYADFHMLYCKKCNQYLEYYHSKY